MEGKPDVTVTSANRKFAAITGSGRKIRDNAADWHNLMLKWEKLNEDGLSAATNIVNIRRSLVEELPSSSSSSSSLFAGGAAELQDECSKLQYVVDKLVVVVMKMERLMRLQQGIQDLDEFQFGPEGRMCPLFHTWKTGQFESTSRFLLDIFSKELKLKQTILQELAHTASADLCMVYLSCWLHQPFVPPQTRMTLEALLLETGHRSV
ncbi:cyclin-dependent kinase 2-interacting protein [Betta splendens]|uniref:Cyclin-dependent kinase 2-interacting protein n=1 Tax=Betta splendens TaxID=158456 RepID=A0A6P7LJ77_BETSP|nr:cyclin-dependent kinase 2-interacting protein [Betta splendens]